MTLPTTVRKTPMVVAQPACRRAGISRSRRIGALINVMIGDARNVMAKRNVCHNQRVVVRSFAVIMLTVAVSTGCVSYAEQAHAVPAPSVSEPASDASSEVAVLAGGCFWGVQGVYQHVKGVTSAVSGYAGGTRNTAHYQMVSDGDTGHAEAVQIAFDPRQITYGKLLQIFFSVAHDPTTLNRQGPDVGAQYRSTIFPANDEQARIARAYIAQLNDARVFKTRIVTTIESGRPFFPAEAYHQDYLTLHPHEPYIVYNDLPKLRELKRLFADLYRDEPVLVGQSR
jgi:peptide-methionine (S)-S-oxide reductase